TAGARRFPNASRRSNWRWARTNWSALSSSRRRLRKRPGPTRPGCSRPPWRRREWGSDAGMEKHQAHVRYTAEEYDRYNAAFVTPFDEILEACVLEEAAGRPSGSVLLDVGAGTARFLVRLAALPQLGSWRLVGTDVFRDMVEQARATILAANAV